METVEEQAAKPKPPRATTAVELLLGRKGGKVPSFFPDLAAPPLRSHIEDGTAQLNALLSVDTLAPLSRAAQLEKLDEVIRAQHADGNEPAVLAGLDVYWRTGRSRRRYLRLVKALASKPVSEALWHVLQYARTDAENLSDDLRKQISNRLARQRPRTVDGRIAMVLPGLVDSWPKALESVHTDHYTGEEETLRWFYDAYDGPPLSFEEYATRARRGRAARELTTALHWVHTHRRPEGHYAVLAVQPPLRRMALDMWDHVDPYTKISKDAYGRVAQHLKQGRSVVTTVTHAGFMSMVRAYSSMDKMPITIVGAGQSAQGLGTDGNFAVLSVRKNATRNFLELIRKSRSEPQFVGIAADGLFGGAAVERRLLDRPIWLRTGAADLAYAMQAAVFHAGTAFENNRIKLPMSEGPVVEPGMDKADWREMYFDFFVAQLERIVRGAPEAIHATAGPDWNIFAGPDGKQQDAAEE